ncbi:MAG: glycosyltransferase family 2 protein [Bacteroidales bacterium]|jgi:glycosyltransferase involved in cell wall biosynthesis|nr:glycosyltransferase family 2 protein [Bacteroidales bacterium]
MNKFNKISIVIPAYNEGAFIESCLQGVIKADTLGLKKEIIIVDDASEDNTAKIVKQFLKKHKEVAVITLNRNQGKGAALKAGFLKTTGGIVLIQDADLEYDPADYPLLIEPFIQNNADVVYGSRLVTNKPHRVLYYWHYLVNKFLTNFSNMLTNLNLTDMETGYKVFKGDIIRKIAPTLESKRFGFEPEITAKISKIPDLKIFEVGISYSGRTYREGKKIGWKDGVKAIWEILKFNLTSD